MLRVEYADFRELLAGRMVTPGVWELRQFSKFLPFAPGDTVKVADGRIVGYVNLVPTFVVEVYFRMDTPFAVVQKCGDVWGRSTDVEVSSPLTVLLSSQSYDWLKEVVEAHELVEFVDVLRVPTQLWSFDQKVREA